MHRVIFTALFAAACLLAKSLAADEFRPLFNGQDLTGWEGDSRLWSVRDGVIRGETTLTSLVLSNTFLIWRGGVLKDFELRLQFRIRNGNSGVQYRSKDLGSFRVSGYQAEIENTQGKVGFLYEERGRKYLANVGEQVEITASGERKVSAGELTKEQLIKAGYYNEKDWNEYRIVARGNQIEHYLNGHRTIALTDSEAKKRSLEGILALQIHAGPPMLVEFREILLKDL
jgi:hypothetical protein